MRKFDAVAVSVLSILALAVSSGCARRLKSLEARAEAESRISEAQAAGAEASSPDLYRKSLDRFEAGEFDSFTWRYNLASCEYNAAADDAEAAALLASARGGKCPPPPPCESNRDCCLEYDLARKKIGRLEKDLEDCGELRYVTRWVRGSCEDHGRDQAECPEAEPASPMVGVFSLEAPAGIEKGKTDYSIKARYNVTRLEDKTGKSGDYRLLLDVEDVDPPEVDVIVPMSDFESVGGKGGSWDVAVKVPDGVKGPVKVKLAATLWNAATDKEEKLPALTAVIPDMSACPQCPAPSRIKIEEIEPPKAPKPKSGGGGFLGAVLFIVGLVLGLVLGYFISSKMKRGPSIKAG